MANLRRCTHFLWLSVRVIPCEDTLKWTTVEVGGGLELRVMVVAFCTAWTPVSDSISTEHKYHTLQAAGGQRYGNITLLSLDSRAQSHRRANALSDSVNRP